MRRQANYVELTREARASDHRANENLCQLDYYENPFDDPEVRQRVAELIARAARGRATSAD
jgi:hypothetical protein